MADIQRIKSNISKMIDGGADESEIDDYIAAEGITVDDLKGKYGVGSKPEPSFMETAGDYASGLQESISQGIGFGFVDEARAAGQATGDAIANMIEGQPANWMQNYDEALPRVRGEQDKFAAEYPKTAVGGEIGGAVVNPVTKMLPALKGDGMLPAILKGTGAGATMGGLYGAGNADGDIKDRAEGAAIGAGIGGVTGGAVPPLMAGLGKGGQALANQIKGRKVFGHEIGGAGTAAQRKVIEALERDGLSLTQAEARVAKLGPQAALMDVGPNSQALARAVYTQPGQGKTVIGDALKTRQEGIRNPATMGLEGGQINRVTQSIDDMIPGDARATRAATQAERSAKGASYEAAKSADDLVDVQPVLASIDDEIAKSKGGIKTALQKVRSYLVDDAGNPEITVDTLHQAKMAIDDLMSGEARSSMGNVAKGRIRAYQDQLVNAIESAGDAGKSYREGRLGTAAAWRIDDALEAGEQFMLKRAGSADDIADMLKNMRPEEQEAFRTGAAQAIKSKIGDMNTRSDVTKKLMDIPNLEAKVKTAFGSDDIFRKYIGNLENERQLFESYSSIMKPSQTASILAEQADAGVDPGRIAEGTHQMMSLNPLEVFRGVSNVVGGVKDRAMLPAPMRSQIADILTKRDVSGLRPTSELAGLEEARRKALSRMLTSGGAYGGGQAGP